MAEIPQFQDTQPIIQTQKVESGADSYEAFAKTLGSIAQKAGTAAEEIVKEQSNSMYLTSLSNIDEMKLSVQEGIATDPSNAAKYVESMRDNLDKMNKAAYVNSSDRQKLDRYAKTTLNSTELEGIRASVKQAQIGAAYEHYSNWPNQLNAIRDIARTGDQEKLDEYEKNVLEHIKSLVTTGSLTPLQGGAAIKSMSDIIELEKDVHDMIQNVEHQTPQNFHAAMSSPLEKNTTGNMHYPVDENTNWLVNYHASDRSFQAASDDVQQHRFNVRAYENMTPAQRNEIRQQINGIRMADGLINANSSLPAINSRINDLEGRTDYASVAEKKSLKQYVSDIKDGNSERLMARTTIGGKIVRDYTDNQSYLNNKLMNTRPEDKEEVAKIKGQIAQSKNEYVNNSIAYAEGHHWPTVHPIPKEDLAFVENGFSVKGDPAFNASKAYETFKQYTPQNQMYFADQMKNPRHKVVLQTIALSGQSNTQQEKIDFIAANQNRTYKEIDLKTEDAISDDYLKNQINTQIAPAMRIIAGQNNPIDATILNGQLIAAGVNYAKFISEKNGQFSMKKEGTFNSINNVGMVTSFINKSYEPLSGANYIINKKQNDIEPIQMDAIAQHAITEGENYLRRNMSEAAFIQLKNQAPLTVTITPTNIVQAKDANGNVAFSAPMGSDLLALAESDMKKMKAEKLKASQKLFEESRKRRNFLSPEEQLLNVMPRIE